MSPINLIIISILGWGAGSFFYKGANTHIHPMMVSSIATCVYALAIPVYFTFVKFDHSVNSTGLVYTVLGSICMCAGSMAYFYALRVGAAGQVTAITALYPGLTLLLSYLFLGENLSPKKILGMIFAFAAAYFLSLK